MRTCAGSIGGAAVPNMTCDEWKFAQPAHPRTMSKATRFATGKEWHIDVTASSVSSE